MTYLVSPLSGNVLGAVSPKPRKCAKDEWPPTDTSMAGLYPPFRKEVEKLLARLRSIKMPFAIRATTRSYDWQCCAIDEGGSALTDPSRSAHTIGMAIDIYPINAGKWEVGLNKPHTQVTNPAIATEFTVLGSLIQSEFPKLYWGGNFKGKLVKKFGVKRSDILFGWDPWHVEWKDYKKHFPPKSEVWTCKPGGKAVRVTDKAVIAQKVVERTVDEDKGTLTTVAVAGVIGWYLWSRRKKR